MVAIQPKQDYDYFRALWGGKKSDSVRHTPEIWDSRADDWGKELAQSGPFRRSVGERVEKAAEFLRGHGLLGPGSEVVDIGCGPGRFVAEFARTAGHVTGVDLSPRMLELGVAHAAECGLSNTSFVSGDFKEFDIAALGWEEKFDLVFTSITPAIGTVESLEKAMAICRGHCFNSCFIHWEDDLERRISEEVFQREYKPSPHTHGQWFYALFNLLWLQGYFPETHYHRQSLSDREPAGEDLARYYAKSFSGNMTADEQDVRRIHRFLQQQADRDGNVLRESERRYGWILWDVRTRANRMEG